MVTSAADAIFIILEGSGLLGSTADRVLAAHAGARLPTETELAGEFPVTGSGISRESCSNATGWAS